MEKLNKICIIGRKIFPNVFHKDKDNIVGHYLSGNMVAVSELCKQVKNEKSYEDGEKLLKKLEKAHEENDIVRFKQIMDEGQEKYPNIFNPNEDNIAGYFLTNLQ